MSIQEKWKTRDESKYQISYAFIDSQDRYQQTTLEVTVTHTGDLLADRVLCEEERLEFLIACENHEEIQFELAEIAERNYQSALAYAQQVRRDWLIAKGRI